MFDPFAALGLPRDASGSAIKARYHALARRYHPNRHQGSNQTQTTFSDHFYHVHEAYNLLSKADTRRRRAELLDLLQLEDEVLLHFAELLEQADSPGEEQAHHSEEGEGQDGHASSDADDDLPNLGLQRRKTVLSRDSRRARQNNIDSPESASVSTPLSPTKRRLQWPKLANISTILSTEQSTDADYFTKRRKKLKKLEKLELEAFLSYRHAMHAKFEAEEEAEKQLECFERARWRREYFERAPKETRERMKNFQHFMGAVSAFESYAHRQPRRSTLNYGNGTPISGPGESSQFLNPDSARHRPLHKRNWSTDISGDQTDSDEDSGDAQPQRPRKPVASGHWWWHPSQWASHDIADIFRGRRHAFLNGRANTDATAPSSKVSSPFKLVIRQPTELGAVHEGRSSSTDALTPSSREHSPRPGRPPSPDSFNYTIVPSSISHVFGVAGKPRARSPSPVNHGRTSITTPGPEHVPDGCQFEIKRIGHPRYHHVPLESVHCLNDGDKARLLGAEVAVGAALEAEELLKRLAQLDSTVAAKFEVKQDIKRSFNFRLIHEQEDVARQGHQSFIALSYRRKLQVEKNESFFTLPLEREMFEAVWQERQEDEGIWIDQICIDQTSDFERTVSMSAMDMVYRSARRVIVVLDDIEFSAHEGEQLQNHMAEYAAMTHVAPRQRFRRKSPSFLESHESMFRIIRKILRSSWFKRAWCRHEMRLGKHHIFLIPCRRPNNQLGRDVLRFNGKCISHLLDLSTEVPFDDDVELVKPALHAFFRDRSKMAPDETELASHHGNMSTVVAEVFAMEAGGDPRIPAEQREADARKDKIAIILNTMECGLALHKDLRDPRVRPTQEECFKDLLLLGLAARDPGSLCAIGPPMMISTQCNSVLYTPTVADAGLNNSKTLQRLPEASRLSTSTSGTEHYIQLDLTLLTPRKPAPQQHVPDIGHAQTFENATLDDLRVTKDAGAMALARHIFRVCDDRRWGRNRKRYLTHNQRASLLFAPMHEVYVETLACVLQCGPAWMSDIAERYSMGRWKVDLPGACELLIALQNTNGRWPESAWNERAAGFIVDFTNFLIIRGLPQRQICTPEQWRPIWVSTDGGKVLSFVPIANENIKPAIPTVLMNPDYVHLSRLWILEPRAADSGDEWTLLGKTVLFSDEMSIAQMSGSGGGFESQQRIYGRRKTGSNRQ